MNDADMMTDDEKRERVREAAPYFLAVLFAYQAADDLPPEAIDEYAEAINRANILMRAAIAMV